MKQSKKEKVEFAGMCVCVHVCVRVGGGVELVQVIFTITLSNITPLNIF